MEEEMFNSEVDKIVYKIGLSQSEKEKINLFSKLLNLQGKMNPGVFNFVYNTLITKITKNGRYEIINEKDNNCVIIINPETTLRLIISYSHDNPSIVFFITEEYIIDQDLFDEESNDYLSSNLINSCSNYFYYDYLNPNILDAELFYSSNCIMSFSDKGILQKTESENEDNNKDNYLARAYDIILEYYEEKLEMLEDVLNYDDDLTGCMFDDVEMYEPYFIMENQALIEDYNKTLIQYNSLKKRLNRLECKISKGVDIVTYNTTIYDYPNKESYTIKARRRIKEDK